MLATILLFMSFTQLSSALPNEPRPINVPQKLMKSLKSFEPSSALYLPNEDVFIVSSDDTDKKNTPMLFVMNSQGDVDINPVYFDGVGAKTDIESISSYNGNIYALSSLSRNKSGKVLVERNLFTRGKFDGSALKDTEVIELRSMLLSSLPKSQDSRLKAMIPKYDQLLEAEASFVRDGKLFIGLKDPQPRAGVALILELGDVEQIFRNNSVDSQAIKVAYEFQLGKDGKLSDMIFADDKLLLSSTREVGGGSLWSYAEDSNQLREIKNYIVERPEGLSLTKNSGELLVVFDQGDEPALYDFVNY